MVERGALSRGSAVSEGRRSARGAALFLIMVMAAGTGRSAETLPPDVLLVTLDTTRADALSPWGGDAAAPTLERLAARGVRYASAWSAAPLTVPAHATLLTGLVPGAHGVRENGLEALGGGPATLAEVFADAGYRTAAVVGSAILDRRFGLDRGFGHYDDRLTAERTGEFGYPERPAADVVDAALDWLGTPAAARAPRFLWVHFYDPHAPYQAPELPAGAPELRRYRAELERVDRELGRLLGALPAPERWLVAVVGDHGEAFGEHGEREHGLLLHRTTLEVPLLLAGPGVPRGRTLEVPVAARRLAATLAGLAGLDPKSIPGPPLPLAAEEPAAIVLHETWYPASVYGWSPLVAATRGDLRLVLGPSPRIFDLGRDPGEERDAAAEPPEGARALRDAARAYLARHPFPERSPEADAEAMARLAALGYLSGSTGRAGTLDPVEGVALVARFDEAVTRQAAGDSATALAILRELVRASPTSVPFLARAAALERRAGEIARAESLLRSALELQPASEFLRAELGTLLAATGRVEEGERELRRALERNPRSAPAWLALAELAARSGRAAEEERLLAAAVAAGTESAAIRLRRAQIARAAGRAEEAAEECRIALELLPAWGLARRLCAELEPGPAPTESGPPGGRTDP